MADDKLPLELKWGLRSGSVFYFVARELSSAESHYFIVINQEPLTQHLVLLAVCSSQIDKIRRRCRETPASVAIIEPVEYPTLTKPTAIDGNQIFSRSLNELAELVRRKEVRYHPDLPGHLLDRVRAAVLASPLIDEETKSRIRA